MNQNYEASENIASANRPIKNTFITNTFIRIDYDSVKRQRNIGQARRPKQHRVLLHSEKELNCFVRNC